LPAGERARVEKAPAVEEPIGEAPEEEAAAGRQVQVEACEVFQVDRFAG